MGHKQSTSQQQPSSSNPSPSLLTPFNHPIILQGLAGAGKRSVQRWMHISPTRTLTIADTFLTHPPIYSRHWGGNNFPSENDPRAHIIWDFGGRNGVQPIWTYIANLTKAMVLVVDASDRASLIDGPDTPAPLPNSFVDGYDQKTIEEQEAILKQLRSRMTVKQLFTSLCAHRRVEGQPLLVLANKQDQPGAMPPAELAELLGLSRLEETDWRVSGCNAETGEGLAEAFDWLNYIIAAPTNFQLVRNLKYKASHAAIAIARSIYDQRDQRLADGWILAAPFPLPTREDGSTWHATPEQLKHFVLPALTPDPQEIECDRLMAVARGNQATVEFTAKLMASRQEEKEEEEVESFVASETIPATAHGHSDHSSSASSSSTATDSVVQLHNNVSSVISVDPKSNSNSSLPAASPFSYLSSAFIVLPPIGSTTTLTRRQVWSKKHWYSSRPTVKIFKQMIVDDIHDPNQWEQYRNGELLA